MPVIPCRRRAAVRRCPTFGTSLLLIVGITLGFVLPRPCWAQPRAVKSHQKISDTEGGFVGILDDDDLFGSAVSALGDLDADGVQDLAVGVPFDGDGGPARGAVWIVFLNADGTVKNQQKISDLLGDFTGILDDQDQFGTSVTSLGDLDDDGVPDLAVGAKFDGDGGGFFGRGAVWILFLNTNGTVRSHQKISFSAGGFTGTLDDGDGFGTSLGFLGDLNGDAVEDLAVGADGDDDGGSDTGAAWILFLNVDGTVFMHQKISATQGGFVGTLDDGDRFGSSLGFLGDFSGSGVSTLVLGSPFDDDGGPERGALWLLNLASNGTVISQTKISDISGNFSGNLRDDELFGSAVASLGDVDGDGFGDLISGAPADGDGGFKKGAAWILFLQADGTVKSEEKISATQGGFTGILDDVDSFGSSLTSLGDLDDDGVTDVACGAPRDDDGGMDRGSVWTLFLCGVGQMEIAAILPNSGSELGDNQVNILGSEFVTLPDTSILFGGVPGSILSIAADRIVARTPPGRGIVDVSVTSCRGVATLPLSYTYVDPPIAARFGNVNVGLGDRENVLLLNGTPGDSQRIVDVAIGQPFSVEVLNPPSRTTSRYALWVWPGLSSIFGLTDAPADIGRLTFPPPFAGGVPRKTWNLLLHFPLLGFPDFPSNPAPTQLFGSNGRPRAIIATIQGIIRDDGARVPEGFSVTNALSIRIQ